MTNKPLFIPVILGTSRQGRQSEHVAKFIVEQVSHRSNVETELIDIRRSPLPLKMLEKLSKIRSLQH